MIRHALIGFCLLFPGTASADPWPALYDVYDVASDDVLNVRSQPSASSQKIGSLPHDAREIEVVAQDQSGEWGQLNLGEVSGWASLRFLSPSPAEPGQTFPAITSCYGTEPFWNLTFANSGIEFSHAFDDLQSVSETLSWNGSASGYVGRYAFVAGNMTGFVSRTSCNDGMSDRQFGIEIDLLLGPGRDSDSDYRLFHGCCSIQPPAE